jgi:hypothetical protein
VPRLVGLDLLAPFLTGKCPGGTEVRCCPSGGVAGTVMAAVTGPRSARELGLGLVLVVRRPRVPARVGLALGDLGQLGRPAQSARCHAGLDIYTSGAKTVVAMSDGVVTAMLKNWYSCTGGSIDAILVYHESGALAGKTINYGEVNPGTYSVSVGSRVSRGQTLATASRCGMLHFELYSGRQTANQRWLPASGNVGSGCAGNSLSTKPGVLLDPRPIIRCTMPSGARFRNGIGFLNSGELSKFSEDLDNEEGEETTGLDVGGIIGIVVAFLVLCALVAGVAMFIRMRRARGSAQSMSVSNAAYSTSAPTRRPRPLHVRAVRQGVQLRERPEDPHEHSSHGGVNSYSYSELLSSFFELFSWLFSWLSSESSFFQHCSQNASATE